MMNITVFNERDNTTHKISFRRKTVKDLLLQLKINPENVIIVKNNEVLTEEEKLGSGDKIELLSVISGG
ncbi:MAG: MoaD/ThiS family protein [Nanoarchaeota archaeon]